MKLQLTVHMTNGEVEKRPEKEFYYSGERVELVVRPAGGFVFGGWFSEAPSNVEGYARKGYKGESFDVTKRGAPVVSKVEERKVTGKFPVGSKFDEKTSRVDEKTKTLNEDSKKSIAEATKAGDTIGVRRENIPGKGLPFKTGEGEKEVVPIDSRGHKIVEPMTGVDPVTLEPLVMNIVPTLGEDIRGIGTVVVMSESLTLWGECNPIEVKK